MDIIADQPADGQTSSQTITSLVITLTGGETLERDTCVPLRQSDCQNGEPQFLTLPQEPQDGEREKLKLRFPPEKEPVSLKVFIQV